MKKIFYTVLFTLIISAFFAPAALAIPNVTTVRGNVYNMDNWGQGIDGLNVSVTCLDANNIPHNLNAITSNNGLYTVVFNINDCPAFAPVSSVVTFNSQTKTQTVHVSSGNEATLDYYFGALVSVPEFGILPGVVAGITSIGAYFALRKKKRE